MIIKYNESLRDAQILARSGDSMRIALEHCDDAVELNLVDGDWLSEEGNSVSFEFLSGPEIHLLLPENGALERRFAVMMA